MEQTAQGKETRPQEPAVYIRERVTLLAEGVADLEYSVRTHELLKRWFSRSLVVHIVVSVAFYALLVGHIVSGIYFGLRWLP